MTLTTGGNVGIGTTTPGTYGKFALLGAATTEGYAVNTATTGQASWWALNNTPSRTGVFQYGTSQAAYGAIGSGEGALYSSTNLTVISDTGVVKFATGGNTERMRIDSAGNVGIGTTTMTRNFNVGGSNAAVGMNLNNTGTSGRSYSIFSTNSSAATVGSLAFFDDTAGAYRMVINSNGNLGIGTISPDVRLVVFGATSTNGDAVRNMLVLSSETAGAGVGGGISFGGWIDGTSSLINDFAGIQGFKENGTANNFAGALRFTTRVNGGSPTERMRITSGGSLVIAGTTALNGERLSVQAGNGILNKTQYALNGTGLVQIYAGTGGMILLRDDNNGGTAMILYENSGTPIIVSQSGSNYTTGSPTGTQIRLSSSSQAMFANMASGQSCTLNVGVYSVDNN
jgi:hypothetical protein